jgi:hypothetical protein
MLRILGLGAAGRGQRRAGGPVDDVAATATDGAAAAPRGAGGRALVALGHQAGRGRRRRARPAGGRRWTDLGRPRSLTSRNDGRRRGRPRPRSSRGAGPAGPPVSLERWSAGLACVARPAAGENLSGVAGPRPTSWRGTAQQAAPVPLTRQPSPRRARALSATPRLISSCFVIRLRPSMLRSLAILHSHLVRLAIAVRCLCPRSSAGVRPSRAGPC